MNRRYRKTVIAGNWKMNKTPAEAKSLIEELKPLIGKVKWCDIVLCVPFVDIYASCKILKESRIAVGAQNVHEEAGGAYTGEVSAQMLNDAGVKYVIIGHSERRRYNGETDILVNKKAHAVLNAGLRPIICVGETLEEREMGYTNELIAMQVKAALANITTNHIRRVVIAYEPVWAIGTGRTATAAQANEVGAAIRTVVRNIYGARVARSVSILYGGSMNAQNAHELLSQPDVDGGLIGGASLKSGDFAAIVNAANQ